MMRLNSEGIQMRRFLSIMVVVGSLASLVGCTSVNPCNSSSNSCNSCRSGLLQKNGHNSGGGCVQGICDCEMDDHCLERQPWLCTGHAPFVGETIVTPPGKLPIGGEVVPLPKTPDGKKL